jgi:hypothetical protein
MELTRFYLALAVENLRLGQKPSQSHAWLWPKSQQALAFTRASRAISGFGLRNFQARPKANPGHNFGLALAVVVPEPKS